MYTEAEKSLLKEAVNKMIDNGEGFAMVDTAEIIGMGDVTDTYKYPSIRRRTWNIIISRVVDIQ